MEIADEQRAEWPWKDFGRQIRAVPNLLSLFRLILIPFMGWQYLTAESEEEYLRVAILVAVSGITDFLDGKIARRFNQITELGKALDPIADKLTLGALVIFFSIRHTWMLPILALMVLKEGFMAVMGCLLLSKKGRKLGGAQLTGKAATALLYLSMTLFLLFPQMPENVRMVFLAACFISMLIALISYIPVFYRMWKGK